MGQLQETNPPSNKSARKTFIPFVIFLFLIALFLLSGRFLHLEDKQLMSSLGRFPTALSVVLFVILYVVVTFFIWLGPKDAFRIAAAYMYGAYLSTFVVWLAEMINLVVLFSLSRRLGRAFVEEKMPGGLKRWDRSLAETGFWSIFYLRIFPVVPFRFLDVGFGLTGISLKKYFMISALATPARIFVIQFFLALGLDTVAHPARFSLYLQEHPAVFAAAFLYFLAAIGMGFFLRRKCRRK